MNCTEIHEGLLLKEIRDFLSIQLTLAFEADVNNVKKIHMMSDFDDSLEWAKADAREHIKSQEKYILNIEYKQAILKLIEINNWKEFDVSDDVHNNTGHSLGMTFIGTDVEYKSLLLQIYPKNE